MKFFHHPANIANFVIFASSMVSMATSLSNPATAAATTKLNPYGTAEINYSAANEYLDEQYEQKIPNPYFPNTKTKEPVYNGRDGVYDDDTKEFREPSLETCGFALRPLPAPDVDDWTNKRQLRDNYLPELRAYFENLYGKDKIRHLLFYNPMSRGEELNAERRDLAGHELPTSPTQTMAHMDNDWIASNVDRVVGLVEKQTLDYFDDPNAFPRQALMEDIQRGYRYMVVNCWRNAGDTPIQRAPLGVHATKYRHDTSKVFPEVQPDFSRSRWYVFPEMTKDECLLFKQYDRDDRYISDVWHCALHSLSHNKNKATPRKSFDVRAFIILEQQVPKPHDRYGEDRLEPKFKTAEEHQANTN